MITSKILSPHTGIKHAFFGRQGGVSQGIYQSLNCGFFSDDAKADIEKNRAICASKIDVSPDHLVTLCQCHSNKVEIITSSSHLPLHAEADALVTAIPGLALGILSADCAPVLFYASDIHAIAAAHAGWRGALNGVVENTLDALFDMGAQPGSIYAAIGPCIHQQSYEVGPEFVESFLQTRPAYKKYFIPSERTGHSLYDNSHFIKDRLTEKGITHIEILPFNTYTQPDRFFSFRRSVHTNEPDYGRQLSVITLAQS